MESKPKEEPIKVPTCIYVKCYIEQIFNKLIFYMYHPMDPSSLGITRFFFGALMLADLPEERGGADIDLRWGEPRDCHFPLFSFMEPIGFPYMSLLYGLMWFGAFGIMLGYKFKISVLLFAVPYWYILLLDKSFWNNHSYLYGILSILFAGSCANHYFSLDGIYNKKMRNSHVPYWNYFILKFQFFMLYFLAGLKKTDMEWLEGYSMTNLGTHWVFYPFQIILTTEQIDYLIVHWFGFLLDLTIGFWMLIDVTRPIAMIFCASFHLMNSRLFSIGMFPYVCLATMPLFCQETWPKKIIALFKEIDFTSQTSLSCLYYKIADKHIQKNKNLQEENKIQWRHKFVICLLLTHCGLQAFLPYSHFITKGYNNWTSGLYGYSWDMMVHSWDTILVVVKVVDNQSGVEHFIDPEAWTQNERWTKHADMCMQYAHCIKKNIVGETKLIKHKNKKMEKQETSFQYHISDDISVYVDVWCSLNGRFQQRMYDPNYDLVHAIWSPFQPVPWLLPILTEYNNLRTQMNEIQEIIYSWSNDTDVLFIADFPGLFLENFIKPDVKNVSLTVLEGTVFYEMEDNIQSFGVKLNKGESTLVETNNFHKIHVVSKTPACFMYVYSYKAKKNYTKLNNTQSLKMYSPFPFIEDVQHRIEVFLRMIGHISNSFLHVVYNKPITRRTRLKKTFKF